MSMKVLVVGSGGREHALAWKIAQSPLVGKLFCAPGNAGIYHAAECIPVAAEDLDGIENLAVALEVDLVVIGPEGPLAAGLTDRLQARGLVVFGPSKAAAAIEGSKAFMKGLCARHNIPSAPFALFREPDPARRYIRAQGAPIVVKTSGLAAGKGAIVCHTVAEAEAAVDRIMVRRAFGSAGDEVVVEGFLQGEEVSLLALVDGVNLLPLAGAQDHKAIGEGDTGPNTGGMGAYSPTPVLTEKRFQDAMEQVMRPTVAAMAAEGRPYRGVLYAGLMIDGDQIQVLEFNARFGDPEAQPLLMRMQSDIVPLLMASAAGSLKGASIAWKTRTALCVVMASGGYPGSYEKGQVIVGLEAAGAMPDVAVFHAGTALTPQGTVTAGGRVLGVTALGYGTADAQRRAYEAVGRISWEGVQYRRDIGYRAIAKERL